MTTKSQIDLYFRYRITDEAGFRKYLEMVLPVTEADEPYVLEYELSRGEDGVILQHERYADEAAIESHLELTADGQKVWADSTELIDIRFVGYLSVEFRQKNDLPIASWWQHFRSVTR